MRQAAAIAGVDPHTVASWVKKKKLDSRKQVRHHLVVTLVPVWRVVELAGQISRGRKPKGGRT